jgi:hypothetical protein
MSAAREPDQVYFGQHDGAAGLLSKSTEVEATVDSVFQIPTCGSMHEWDFRTVPGSRMGRSFVAIWTASGGAAS